MLASRVGSVTMACGGPSCTRTPAGGHSCRGCAGSASKPVCRMSTRSAKLTRRLGPDVVDDLNVPFFGLAVQGGHLRLERFRRHDRCRGGHPVPDRLRSAHQSGESNRRVDATRGDRNARQVHRRHPGGRHHAREIGMCLRRRRDEAKAKILVIAGLFG